VFDRIAGLIVGRPEHFDAQGAPFTLDELILEIIGSRSYPIVTSFDCSHTHPMLTLAERTLVTLDATGRAPSLVIERPMVVGDAGRFVYLVAPAVDVARARERGAYGSVELDRSGYLACTPADLRRELSVRSGEREELVELEIDLQLVDARIVWESFDEGSRTRPSIYGEIPFKAVRRTVSLGASEAHLDETGNDAVAARIQR
jgi:uncharacterized protein (DUF952 family)